jgi:hypothetical protein
MSSTKIETGHPRIDAVVRNLIGCLAGAKPLALPLPDCVERMAGRD